MKWIKWWSLLITVALLQAGCLTLSAPKTLDEKCAAASEVGKFVTLVYYSEKERVDPKGEVAQVYKVFSEVLAATDSGTLPILFRAELEKQIRAKVNGDYRDLAIGLVAIYWDRLSARVDIDKATGSEMVVILRAFKQGVEEMRTVLKGPTSGAVRPAGIYDGRYHFHIVCGERRHTCA
jgi:hypothetical protein